VAERGRQIPPRTAGSGDPQHSLDKQSVVLAAAAGKKVAWSGLPVPTWHGFPICAKLITFAQNN
jgi:hypothetical protein